MLKKETKEQSSLKTWEASFIEPEYSIGDRVKWYDDWNEEEKFGTIVGVDDNCYGKGWTYVIIPDKGTAHPKELNEEELLPHNDPRPKTVIMEEFGRRVYDL